MRKSLILLLSIVLLTSLVIAEEYKIEISTLSNTFESGGNMTLKVTLLDSGNNPVNGQVSVIIEDSEHKTKIQNSLLSNKLVEIPLEKSMTAGQGTITATYNGTETIKLFDIKEEQKAKFETDGEKLIVTNIGNTKYQRKIQITIGGTTGVKEPSLDIGGKISYRLIAPKGVYNIKVSDGVSEPLVIEELTLTGTGDVVGVIDETASQRAGITGGISPNQNDDLSLLSYVKNNKFTYVFILVIFGATILLAIERNYRKKAN